MLFAPPPIASLLKWFPRHQQNTLRLLKDGLHHIDLVVEVRDARIPLSGANHQFVDIFGQRDKIIVFNKMELANQNMSKMLADNWKLHSPDPFLFTTAKPKSKGAINNSMKTIMKLLVDKVNSDPQRLSNLSIVVVGLPNVGKSSIINALRHLGVNKGKASEVAPFAGVTRAIQTKVKIHQDPTIYLVDTPGVLNPQVKSPIHGLRIALAGCTKDSLSNELAISEYLLYRLNQSRVCANAYSSLLGLDGPTTEINKVIKAIISKSNSNSSNSKNKNNNNGNNISGSAKNNTDSTPTETNNTTNDDNRRTWSIPVAFNQTEASHAFISMFRQGAFGPMTLDDCSAEGVASWFAEMEGAGVVRDPSLQREGLRGKIIYVD